MNRAQLEMLGEAGLRQMARQVGLRGARHHRRDLLITGLVAYFSRRPDDDDDEIDDEIDDVTGDEPGEDPSLGADEIPPALATETMARLLESQGETAKASALRARLAQRARPRTSRSDQIVEAPRITAPAVHVEHKTPEQIELVWEGAHGAHLGLVVRLWTRDAPPTQWELPVTAPQGRMQFDPPPNTTRMCAALGRLSPEGFVPAARSAVIVLAHEPPPHEPPS